MFHPLKVKSISKTTDDCVIVSLDVPEDQADQFVFDAGQYLTLKTTINGEEVRRSYSLCSSPLDTEWKVGVKKVPGGKFSTFANEVLEVGDTLDVMQPAGKFKVNIDPDRKRHYAAFAAGSGITPIYSIIKTQLTAEPSSTFKLFYVNQTAASVILKEELEALKNKFLDRLQIFYFLTREQRGIPLFNGRIDEQKLNIISKTLLDLSAIDHYFICGPEPMIHLINDFLAEQKVEKQKVHFELFGTNLNQQVQKQVALATEFKGKACEVTVIEGGKSINFKVEQGSGNVLDAALNNSADLPFACKGGVCATCRAKVKEGEVNMLLSYGLEQDEIDAGYILTCQSIPTSEKLVVDFDA